MEMPIGIPTRQVVQGIGCRIYLSQPARGGGSLQPEQGICSLGWIRGLAGTNTLSTDRQRTLPCELRGWVPACSEGAKEPKGKGAQPSQSLGEEGWTTSLWLFRIIIPITNLQTWPKLSKHAGLSPATSSAMAVSLAGSYPHRAPHRSPNFAGAVVCVFLCGNPGHPAVCSVWYESSDPFPYLLF